MLDKSTVERLKKNAATCDFDEQDWTAVRIMIAQYESMTKAGNEVERPLEPVEPKKEDKKKSKKKK